MSNSAALRPRLGDTMDRTLFCGTVGAAWASVAVSGTSGGGGSPFADSGRVKGVTDALGVDHAGNASWTFRADLCHTSCRNRAIAFGSAGPGAAPHLCNPRVRSDALRLGAADRFGPRQQSAERARGRTCRCCRFVIPVPR